MIKHTPGPWRYDKRNPSPTTGEHMIAGGKPGYLAEVRDCGSGDIVANARLIAAAPDMYALLRDVVALLNNPDADQFDADKVERRILDVLNKVEGA